MTALVLVALAWTFLAMSTAFVIGHGIRLADSSRPVRAGGSDEMWPAADERQAVPAS